MLRALISPKENAGPGQRVAQVVDVQKPDDEFPAAPPLFWTDAPAGADMNTHYYDDAAKAVQPIPAAPAQPPSQKETDRADALAKLDDAAADAGTPPKLRAMLAALKKIL